jgi:hypothetical protein
MLKVTSGQAKVPVKNDFILKNGKLHTDDGVILTEPSQPFQVSGSQRNNATATFTKHSTHHQLQPRRPQSTAPVNTIKKLLNNFQENIIKNIEKISRKLESISKSASTNTDLNTTLLKELENKLIALENKATDTKKSVNANVDYLMTFEQYNAKTLSAITDLLTDINIMDSKINSIKQFQESAFKQLEYNINTLHDHLEKRFVECFHYARDHQFRNTDAILDAVAHSNKIIRIWNSVIIFLLIILMYFVFDF